MKIYIFTLFIGQPNLYVFHKRGKIDFISGVIRDLSAPSVTGDLYVWTDVTSGPKKVDYPQVVMNGTVWGPQQLPECVDNEEYSCNVLFQRQAG